MKARNADLPPASRASVLVTAGIVFAVAFAVRAAHVLSYQHNHFLYFETPTLDAQFYDAWAKRILGGEWIGTKVFEGVPLYGYFLAVVYKLFGTGPVPIALMQSFFGALGTTLLYFFARAAFSEAVALLTAGFAAFYAPFILYESFRLADGLATFFASAVLLASLAFLKRPTVIRAIGTGLLLGLAVLARERFLLFAPLLVLFFVWQHRKATPRVRTAIVCVLLVAGLAVPLGISLAHNLAAAGDGVLLSSSGGVNFYIGNQPAASGSFDPPPEFGKARGELYERAKLRAQEALGRQLKASEVSSYWTKRGLEFWSKSAAAAFQLSLKKLRFFWKGFEFPDVVDPVVAQSESAVLSLPLFNFRVIGPIALVGLVVAWFLRRRDPLGIGLLYALLAANVVFMMLFFVSSRFRVSAVPCVLPFAAATVVWIIERAVARRFGALLLGVIGIGLAAVFVNVNPEGTDFALKKNEAISHSNYGQLLFNDKRLAEAEKEFRAAIAADGTYAKARYYLAEILAQTNREEDASRTFQEAFALDPKNGKGRANWGKLLIVWKHDPRRAIPELQQAIRDDPREANAVFWLGVAYSQIDQKEAAISWLRRAAEMDPALADDVNKRIAELAGQ